MDKWDGGVRGDWRSRASKVHQTQAKGACFSLPERGAIRMKLNREGEDHEVGWDGDDFEGPIHTGRLWTRVTEEAPKFVTKR